MSKRNWLIEGIRDASARAGLNELVRGMNASQVEESLRMLRTRFPEIVPICGVCGRGNCRSMHPTKEDLL